MSTTTRRAATALMAVAIVGLLVLFAVSAGSENQSTRARQIDGAFLTAMVPHHQAAVEMADLARVRAKHPEIEKLAGEIIDAQNREVLDMTFAHQRIFGEPLPDRGMAHGGLGLSESEMGMSMDMGELENSREFDRTFIDMMIRHHQGAIRMAQAQLQRGEDPELKALARAIVAAQSREIEQMNSWRRSWYGAASPSGGVPS
jgi:uncharacterized protein (DUF305 family)